MSFEIALRHRIGECELSVQFAVQDQVLGLTGPSGAGKTSLLNCIAGLIRPAQGRIVVGSRVLADTHSGLSVPIEQRHAGYVFQDARLFPHMNVAANLAYGRRRADAAPRSIDSAMVQEVLGITQLANRSPDTLSGGEVRRVAIARALLSGPQFLLLDEPLASLDQPRALEILSMIEDLVREIRIPVLFVTHQPDLLEQLASNILELPQSPLPLQR